jgi:hypothetical protein
MDSLQLRYALLQSSKTFTAVCAKDQLKGIKEKSFAIICNNEDSSMPGMHWLCFYKNDQDTSVQFFDSFGMPIEFYGKDFCEFAAENGKKLTFSKFQYQSNSSNLCGAYCLYVLYYRCLGKSFDEILRGFSLEDTKLNDSLIASFISNHFKFPKFSKCTICCKGTCTHNLSSVCIQKSKHCVRLTNNLVDHNG